MASTEKLGVVEVVLPSIYAFAASTVVAPPPLSRSIASYPILAGSLNEQFVLATLILPLKVLPATLSCITSKL